MWCFSSINKSPPYFKTTFSHSKFIFLFCVYLFSNIHHNAYTFILPYAFSSKSFFYFSILRKKTKFYYCTFSSLSFIALSNNIPNSIHHIMQCCLRISWQLSISFASYTSIITIGYLRTDITIDSPVFIIWPSTF